MKLIFNVVEVWRLSRRLKRLDAERVDLLTRLRVIES